MSRKARGERGVGMLEVLVSLVLVLIVLTSALGMYDYMVKSFKVDENVMNQQQGVRVGFDEVIADVQLAGLNHNPDGIAGRPDEQIEGAFGTALVIRGDFDLQDPTESATPEASLAGGAYDTVSTGNDEIVTYVLAKPDGSSSGTFDISADVADIPRDGAVESITIPAVAAVQDAPPYTLYRIALNNDIGTLGGSDFFVRTPLIENVRSLSFRYFDSSGVELSPPGGAETATAVAARANIRRIRVDVVGLTRDPDRDYRDFADANPATRQFRKFGLTGDITPRNLGRRGVRDLAP